MTTHAAGLVRALRHDLYLINEELTDHVNEKLG